LTSATYFPQSSRLLVPLVYEPYEDAEVYFVAKLQVAHPQTRSLGSLCRFPHFVFLHGAFSNRQQNLEYVRKSSFSQTAFNA
jgi:hypothetical protein